MNVKSTQQQLMKDVSVLQGVIEFTGFDDINYRAESEGCDLYTVRRQTEGGWLHYGKFLISGKCTPAKVYTAIQNAGLNEQ